MRLEQLLAGLPLQQLSPGNPEITNLQVDSRAVGPGSLFMAREGWFIDSHQYIAAAIAAGAAAIVVTRLDTVPEHPTVPFVLSSSEDRDLGLMADRFLGHPTRALKVFGVTGTNGKTSVTWLLAHMLRAIGHRPAIIGTVMHRFEDRIVTARNTTPDGLFIHTFARECLESGATCLVMEVSSHGLQLDRVAGVAFDSVGFTNLTPDHLDFHKTFDAYREAKWRLFREYAADSRDAGKAVHASVCIDSAEGQRLAAAVELPVTFVTASACQPAQVALEAAADGFGWRVSARCEGAATSFGLSLPGQHNLENVAVSLAMLAAVEPARWQQAAASLPAFPGVPGRLERVVRGAADEPSVYVDYAHTPDAVARIVAVMPDPSQGGVVVVGCGGDRDPTKRPLMAQAALSRGHRAVFTADNPRSEAPEAILQAMLEGVSAEQCTQVTVIADRSEAIAWAVANAGAGGVWILGKGHETYQEVQGVRWHLDDREEARRALVARRQNVHMDDVPLLAGWTAERVASACGGRVIVDAHRVYGAFYTDTRNPAERGIFCAIPGERFDGHAFIETAIGQNASMLVVMSLEHVPAGCGASVVLVPDTIAAMQRVASAVLDEARKRSRRLWTIAITGSNGKTTTKEMTAALLRAMGHRVLSTPGNWNNRIGIPLTVSRLCAGHDRAVLELGAGDPGDIGQYASFVRHEVGVLTSIAAAHTETLGGMEGVRATKAGIFHGRPPVRSVLPVSELMHMAARLPAPVEQVLTFGAEGADVMVERSGSSGEVTLKGQGAGERLSLTTELALPGVHNAFNLAAALLAVSVQRDGGVEFPGADVVRRAMAALQLPGGRLRTLTAGGRMVIDDAYNANPGSMTASLSILAAADAPRVAVLGDMFELGTDSAELHRRVGQTAARCADLVVAVGEQARALADGAGNEARWFASADEAASWVSTHVPAGATILVKGSRGMALERVVQRLLAHWQEP
jgi:murE/murF fusion protein